MNLFTFIMDRTIEKIERANKKNATRMERQTSFQRARECVRKRETLKEEERMGKRDM